jgi:hypothetical protein
MLRLLRTFIMAAFSTRDADAYQGATLARRSSSVRAGDGGEPEDPETAGEGTSFKQLRTLLEGPMGIEIVELVDYSALQRQVLRVIGQVLKKTKLLFEDRLIVESALNLWVGCLLHRDGLFQELIELCEPGFSADELLLNGLLYCPYETVREEFRQSLSALCSKPRSAGAPGQVGPLEYILQLLSSNFSLISQYPCKQYFELFCELMDRYFLAAKAGPEDGGIASVIDSGALLSAVIDRIREENVKAQQARADGPAASGGARAVTEAAGLFQGLIQLAGKILDSCQDTSPATADQSGNTAQQRGLITEIFTRYLFPTVFEADQGREKKSLTMA